MRCTVIAETQVSAAISRILMPRSWSVSTTFRVDRSPRTTECPLRFRREQPGPEILTELYMGMRPGDLFRQWRRKGQTIGLDDVTIAAVVIIHELALVADNEKHFPMTELRLMPAPI
jgi:hypothetical protein